MTKKFIFAKLMSNVFKLPWLKTVSEPIAQNLSTDHFANALTDLSEQEFVKLVNKIFIQRGYSVITSSASENGVVNLILQINNEKTYVQYEQWKENQVEVRLIAELYARMKDDGVKHGIVITAGIFSPDAIEYARGKILLLINGVDLISMIDVLMQSLAEPADNAKQNLKVDTKQEMPEIEPLCPICSQKMIMRTARKGKNAGNIFWGCSQFPNCRGVISD
jgi:restriction system protein